MYDLRSDIRRLLKKRLPSCGIDIEETGDSQKVLQYFVDRIADSFAPDVDQVLEASLRGRTFEERRDALRSCRSFLAYFLTSIGDKYYESMCAATKIDGAQRLALSVEIYNSDVLLQSINDTWEESAEHSEFRRRSSAVVQKRSAMPWPFARIR